MKPQRRLGEILRARDLVSEAQLDTALAEHARTRKFLGEVLIGLGYIREDDLLAALSEQFGFPVVALKDRYIDWEMVSSLSPALIIDRKCFLVKKTDWAVTIAVSNPLDAWRIKRAEEEVFPLRLDLALAKAGDIEEAV